jgi:hypothetical protein
MKIIKIDNVELEPWQRVSVKEMGNITEIMYMEHRNSKQTIQKIDKDNYVVLATGEIGQFKHIQNRSEDKGSIAKSLRRLRELLNTNITDVNSCRWVTLTYAENMTDSKRLYADFKKFNMRMRYYLNQKNKGNYEYIVAMEPQGRGAWHCHVVMIFEGQAPFIPNKELFEIWGHGFVTIKQLDDVDNVGAYLTAYLGDMDTSEAIQEGIDITKHQIKECEYEEDGECKSKYYVKGARLHMYPPGFRLYRASKGIKEPTSYITTNEIAEQKVNSAKLTFEKTISIFDEKFDNTINYRYYNSNKK